MKKTNNYCWWNNNHKITYNRKSHQEVQWKLINLLLVKKENKTLAKMKFKTKIINQIRSIILFQLFSSKRWVKPPLYIKIQYNMLFIMRKLIKPNNYHIIKVLLKVKVCRIMKIKYLKIKKYSTDSRK
jgi:hypothetical protein